MMLEPVLLLCLTTVFPVKFFSPGNPSPSREGVLTQGGCLSPLGDIQQCLEIVSCVTTRVAGRGSWVLLASSGKGPGTFLNNLQWPGRLPPHRSMGPKHHQHRAGSRDAGVRHLRAEPPPPKLAQYFKHYIQLNHWSGFCFILTKYTTIKIEVSDFLQQLYKTLPRAYSIHVLTSSFHFIFYRKGAFRKLCSLPSLENKFSTSFIYALSLLQSLMRIWLFIQNLLVELKFKDRFKCIFTRLPKIMTNLKFRLYFTFTRLNGRRSCWKSVLSLCREMQGIIAEEEGGSTQEEHGSRKPS